MARRSKKESYEEKQTRIREEIEFSRKNWLERTLKFRYESKILTCYDLEWRNKYILLAEFGGSIYTVGELNDPFEGKRLNFTIEKNNVQCVARFPSIEYITENQEKLRHDFHSFSKYSHLLDDLIFQPIRYEEIIGKIQAKYTSTEWERFALANKKNEVFC